MRSARLSRHCVSTTSANRRHVRRSTGSRAPAMTPAGSQPSGFGGARAQQDLQRLNASEFVPHSRAHAPYPHLPLIPDSAPAADAMQPSLEVPQERLVLWPRSWIGPDRSQPSHQSGDPVRRLDGLIAVALQVEGRLDEIPTALALSVHALGRFGQQRRALLVLLENQHEPSLRERRYALAPAPSRRQRRFLARDGLTAGAASASCADSQRCVLPALRVAGATPGISRGRSHSFSNTNIIRKYEGFKQATNRIYLLLYDMNALKCAVIRLTTTGAVTDCAKLVEPWAKPAASTCPTNRSCEPFDLQFLIS